MAGILVFEGPERRGGWLQCGTSVSGLLTREDTLEVVREDGAAVGAVNEEDRIQNQTHTLE